MLNLAYVNSFVTVVDKGSFHAAAKVLNCSQPTITQHIRKLELDLKIPLVQRGNNGCKPTPRGELFLPYARKLLQMAQRAQSVAMSESFTIGASTNIGVYYLPAYAKAFAEQVKNPEVVKISIGSNTEIADRLANGEVDVALMEWWDGRPGFHAEIWRKEAMVAIVPKDHPWSKRRSLSKGMLLATPMIGGEPGTGTATLLREVFGDAARNLKVSMNLGSTEAVKRAVKAGMGISLALTGAVEQEVKREELHALPITNGGLTKTFFVIVPENLPSSSLATSFVRFITQGAGVLSAQKDG